MPDPTRRSAPSSPPEGGPRDVDARSGSRRQGASVPGETGPPTPGGRSVLFWATAATAAVLFLSPGLELATGSPVAYTLAVTGLLVLFSILVRLRAGELGLRPGDGGAYRAAVLYPLLLMFGLLLIATSAEAPDPIEAPVRVIVWQTTIMAIVTIVGTLISEDGFFRGWLWGALERADLSPPAILLWTSGAFALWHLPVVLIESDFALPAAQIPTYLANTLLIGMCWGVLRMGSGSVFVVAVSHGLWNGMAYVLYGYGPNQGALRIASSELYDPERGLWGLALNLLAFLLLWRWWVGRLPSSQDPQATRRAG